MTSYASARAVAVAQIYAGPINESRKRCGLPALEAAELAREFSDIDRLPAPTRPAAATRSSANQEAIDAMHAGIVAKLNVTLPARAKFELKNGHGLLPAPSSRSGSRSPSGQAEIDAMHAEIVAKLNSEAGLKTPARSPAR
jgi:hypothetical protein